MSGCILSALRPHIYLGVLSRSKRNFAGNEGKKCKKEPYIWVDLGVTASSTATLEETTSASTAKACRVWNVSGWIIPTSLPGAKCCSTGCLVGQFKKALLLHFRRPSATVIAWFVALEVIRKKREKPSWKASCHGKYMDEAGKQAAKIAMLQRRQKLVPPFLQSVNLVCFCPLLFFVHFWSKDMSRMSGWRTGQPYAVSVNQVTSATVWSKRSVLLAKQDSMERRRVAHWRQQRVKSAQQENILPPRDQHFVLFAPRASSLRHQE